MIPENILVNGLAIHFLDICGTVSSLGEEVARNDW